MDEGVVIIDENAGMTFEEMYFKGAIEGLDYEYKQNKTDRTWFKVRYPTCERCGLQCNLYHARLNEKEKCKVKKKEKSKGLVPGDYYYDLLQLAPKIK